MKVVFVNLHTNGFYVKDIDKIISHCRVLAKHRFILDWFINNNIEVANLITINGTKLPTDLLKKLTRKYIFRKIEAKIILKREKLYNVNIITDPNEIDERDIVLYYGTFNPAQFENIEKVKGVKFVDHIHFYGEKEAAAKIKDKNIKYFINDVDLRKYSQIYSKNYSWFKGEYIMRPFAYQPRFCVKKKFSDRKVKAVAVGTITKRNTPDFIETYGTECYQPRRKMVMDNAPKYKAELDSYITKYEEKPLKQINDKDIVFIKLYKRIYNYFNCGQQKSYFSFDMVDKYNEYKMFICPEDVQGSYGIGTIEGMACGCAMIGWDYGAFEDMGMEAGKHYISYDGTIEDLIKKIRYYQEPKNQTELEEIAKTGCEFVRRNFSQDTVARNFYKVLKKISEDVQTI